MKLPIWLSTVAAVVSVLGTSGGARSFDLQRPDGDPAPNIRVHSDLVVLQVAVLDKDSRFVAGLADHDFSVYEDNVLQPVTVFRHDDSPATVGLVIDNSGSMRPKLPDVIAASQAFARASNPSNELFIVNFNEKVWHGLPPEIPFTSDIDILTRGLSATRAVGLTALYDAIDHSLDHVAKGAFARRVLVVISDGGDNASAMRLDRILQRAGQSDVVIYAMALFDDSTEERNPAVLKQFAAVTGGESFFPDNARQATETLQRIAEDVRRVYTIGYVPTNVARDGKIRKIRVALDAEQGKKRRVRARSSYVAPLEARDASAAAVARWQ